MRYASGGIEEVRALSRFAPWTILGAGLLLATATALAPLVFGRQVLEAALLDLDLPLLGHVKATSALPLDVGVYLLVVGLVLMVFEAFGDDPTLDQGEGSRA
jgi:multicomponent Na+:H+ antiporter subunit A